MTRTTFGWQCIHKVLYSVDTNSAVTYLQIKITDAERTEKKSKKCLSGDGSCLSGGEDRRGSRKERIRTKQVTDQELSTNVRVTDV